MLETVFTTIDDVRIITPKVFKDNRGYFFQSFNKEKYEEVGITNNWVQDNESQSSFGVLRGLHYQKPPYTQAKLVRVVLGKVLDVAVDIRSDSKTFGKYAWAILSDENKQQLYIPRGFAHGFVVLSEKVIFSYKCDNVYMPSHEAGILFDDPNININWIIPSYRFILSEKDLKHPQLINAEVFTTAEFNS